MSEVFIPLGGAGGKNRGSTVYMDENYTHLKMGDTASMALPLPAGVYKKFKPERADDTLPESITSSGDGKNAVIVLEDKLLKKMALEAFEIASITNFRLSMYAHRQVRLTWAIPSEGLWNGVHFVFKYGSMPTDENDGFMVYDSADVHYETPKLEERELFVRAYSYVTVRDGRWYDEGAVSSRITVTGISGSVTLSTGAGVWTVPDNVYKIRYILVGHGGDGTRVGYYMSSHGGGGGGGGYFTTGYMNVFPGQSLSWAIPSVQGQNTLLGNLVSKSGKMTEPVNNRGDIRYTSGGDGGSGGGGSSPNGIDVAGGCGGSNGSNGCGGIGGYADEMFFYSGGKGQKSSTRGFNGVLYSGGGGAGGPYIFNRINKLSNPSPDVMEPIFDGKYYSYPMAAKGGEGGGGDSEHVSTNPNGIDGLGGGGGGGSHHSRNGPYGPASCGKGGTGCIYIAWGSLMNDGS